MVRSIDKKSLNNMQLLLQKMHAKQVITPRKVTGINSLSIGNATNSLNVQKGDVFFTNNSFPTLSQKLSAKQKSEIGASTIAFEDSRTVLDNKTGNVLSFWGKDSWRQVKKNIKTAIQNLLDNFESDKIKKNTISITS